jgi:transcriptional regulator with XRE-family HTH domain
MDLSEKIKIVRKARGYSQEELGDKVGVSRQTVSDWEKGKFEPTLESIRCLAQVLEVSFDTLLDEDIDLNDKRQLNIALKDLSEETKEKVNNSFRYRIQEYTVTKKDYAFVITYFSIMDALAIAMIPVSIFEIGIVMYVIGIALILLLSMLALPISRIKKIKNGGYHHTFGTLSMTHFVIIGWSDSVFDRTVYVPVTEIESMELDKNAKKKHGKVIVRLKGRNKPIVTSEIVNPQKLIDVFNNRETFIETYNGK